MDTGRLNRLLATVASGFFTVEFGEVVPKNVATAFGVYIGPEPPQEYHHEAKNETTFVLRSVRRRGQKSHPQRHPAGIFTRPRVIWRDGCPKEATTRNPVGTGGTGPRRLQPASMINRFNPRRRVMIPTLQLGSHLKGLI
jgi:hypothetical protein